MKLIKFGAPWCAPCRKLTEDLKKHPLSIDLEEINVEEDEHLAEKYSIYQVPSLVLVDEEGKEIDRKLGALPVIKIEEWIKSYIGK